MKLQSMLKKLVVTAALVVSFNASASLIFNFDQDLSDDQHMVSYTVNGLTMSVSAFDGASTADVHRQWNGLGVSGSSNGTNIASPESLMFSLDQAFNGTIEILFTNWNRFDSAEIGGEAIATQTIAGAAANPFSSIFSGSEFSVLALPVAGTINDKFRIQQITLTGAVATVVSEPGTAFILMLGLMGLVLRRKSN